MHTVTFKIIVYFVHHHPSSSSSLTLSHHQSITLRYSSSRRNIPAKEINPHAKWVPLSHSHSSCVPTTQCQGLFCILFLLCILSMDDAGLETHSSLDWRLGFRDVVLICILEVVGFLWMSGHWHRVKLLCGKHSG